MASEARTSAGDETLDRMQWIADPEGDRVVASILGPWTPQDEAERFGRVKVLNQILRGWDSNASITALHPKLGSVEGISGPLQAFIDAARRPPTDWQVDQARLERAEKLFMDQGVLSVTLLFCGSLPECYVVPDLAAVLHATGQLEKRTEHRIRATGAMIFPVMMEGGLTRPDGAGVAQILKVRIIHAMVRNLILRDSPEEVARRALSLGDSAERANLVPPLAAVSRTHEMEEALHVHGWDFTRRALPNNQEELAYTLLTFSFVFLRGLRRLAIPFTREEEEDYIHAWNVAGHYLGIRREVMVDTMEQAGILFARMQARGRATLRPQDTAPDSRAALAASLMDAMRSVIPPGPLESFPELLTRRMLEEQSVKDLGLTRRVPWVARTLFRASMAATKFIDRATRLVFPDFSISRLVTRVVGYRLTCTLLMSQTRELHVPGTLQPGIRKLVAKWGHDPKASTRMNALEDRLTTAGHWEPLEHPARR